MKKPSRISFIVRKRILKNFLDNLCCISDREYQVRVWIEGRGPECHNFDEAVCECFADG